QQQQQQERNSALSHDHPSSPASPFGVNQTGPYVLILASTRERCTYLETLLKDLCQGLPHMRTALIIGGVPLPNLIYRLRKGVQIVVATPGRLLDVLSSPSQQRQHQERPQQVRKEHKKQQGGREEKLDPSWLLCGVTSVVLDDVDQMVEMRLERKVMALVEKIDAAINPASSASGKEKKGRKTLSGKRIQAVCFSEMMSEDVEAFVGKVLQAKKRRNEAVVVRVGGRNASMSTATSQMTRWASERREETRKDVRDRKVHLNAKEEANGANMERDPVVPRLQRISQQRGVPSSSKHPTMLGFTATAKHTFLWTPETAKKSQLFAILTDPKYFDRSRLHQNVPSSSSSSPPTDPSAIVFIQSNLGTTSAAAAGAAADMLASAITQKTGLLAASLHAGQSERERAGT
ncbi:DEAD (Asp-Glu-Ala-Asp) box polypeptide 59, partial [Quaeritorhiza haematococci]